MEAVIEEGRHVFKVSYGRRMNFIYTRCGVSACGEPPLAEHKYDELVAYWDTGSKMTTVSPTIIERLGIKRTREMRVNCVAGTSVRNTYKIDVYLPGGLIIPNVEVIEGDISRGDVLVGMDIIMLGDFAITNLNGMTSFTFRIPSESTIDFNKPNTKQ